MVRKVLLIALTAMFCAPFAAASGTQNEAVAYAALAGRHQGLLRACPGVAPEDLKAQSLERIAQLNRNSDEKAAALEAYHRALTKSRKRRALTNPALCSHLNDILTSEPAADGTDGTSETPDFAELGRIAGRGLACTKHISDIERFSQGVLRLAMGETGEPARERARLTYANGLAYWYVAERFNAVHKCEFAAEDYAAAFKANSILKD